MSHQSNYRHDIIESSLPHMAVRPPRRSKDGRAVDARVTSQQADDAALRRKCLMGTLAYQSALTAAGYLTPPAPLSAATDFRMTSR
jgi:hypothetical protein